MAGSFLPAFSSTPEPTHIAVAANFLTPARALARLFHDQTGATIELASGSTGTLYAQVNHGAPFAAFLAADAERPALLEAEGKTVAGSRFTYAVGRLVLWSSDCEEQVNEEFLLTGGYRHLAIANPQVAPYGQAARSYLDSLDLWEVMQPRLVMGQNIGQAFGFVQTGNAEVGLVAWSSVLALEEGTRGSWWLVPADRHPPIVQQAVLLTDDPAAAAFLEFLQSPAARDIIRRYGYDLP